MFVGPGRTPRTLVAILTCAILLPLAAGGEAPAPPSQPAPAPAAPGKKMPAGEPTFFKLFHRSVYDAMEFLREKFPAYVDEGNVQTILKETRRLLIIADGPTTERIVKILRQYDEPLPEEVTQEIIKLKYMDVQVALEMLSVSRICQVWHRTEEMKTVQQQKGNKMVVTHQLKQMVYAQYSPAAGDRNFADELPDHPFVLEVPYGESIQIEPLNVGTGDRNLKTVVFNSSPSTEERSRILVCGTSEDIEMVKAYLDTLDRPAAQLMIEVLIVEMAADKLKDIGIDLISGASRHTAYAVAPALPGEALPQPDPGTGFPRGSRGDFTPVTMEGLSLLFDDTTERIAGRFAAQVHALVRTGEAQIRARPKVYTLDERQNTLHIGEEVPTFESTGVTTEMTGGNFVEKINRVAKQYVGITLNLKPRISGPESNEVSMMIDIVVNNLLRRDRVFPEDLLGIPTTAIRMFRGEARVKNHTPLVLGGLIREEESESVSKIPFVGDIPLIGDVLNRRQSRKERMEIILIITPHILSEKGVDRIASPKDSSLFDTTDSVLFNDRYILKAADVIGMDLGSKQPLEGFTRQDVIDLTLLNIVRGRELVRKLRIFDEYLSRDSGRLSLFKRTFPEKSIAFWRKDEQKVYFRAAAIVIESIKGLNTDLSYEDVVRQQREIVLPTSPYRISLRFDDYRKYIDHADLVFRGPREVSGETVNKLLALKDRTLGEFANFVESVGRKEDEHGALRSELTALYRSLYPDGESLEVLPYGEFFRALSKRGVEFTSLAMYFREKLQTRYRQAGSAPDIGIFEDDLVRVSRRGATLEERAEKLQELDERWKAINSTPDQRPIQGL